MVVAIIAWVFTLLCVGLAVFFVIRAYRGWRRLQNEQEIRQIIAMQEALNLATAAKQRQGAPEAANPAGGPLDPTLGSKPPTYPVDDPYGAPDIPDEIPDR